MRLSTLTTRCAARACRSLVRHLCCKQLPCTAVPITVLASACAPWAHINALYQHYITCHHVTKACRTPVPQLRGTWWGRYYDR